MAGIAVSQPEESSTADTGQRASLSRCLTRQGRGPHHSEGLDFFPEEVTSFFLFIFSFSFPPSLPLFLFYQTLSIYSSMIFFFAALRMTSQAPPAPEIHLSFSTHRLNTGYIPDPILSTRELQTIKWKVLLLKKFSDTKEQVDKGHGVMILAM